MTGKKQFYSKNEFFKAKVQEVFLKNVHNLPARKISQMPKSCLLPDCKKIVTIAKLKPIKIVHILVCG